MRYYLVKYDKCIFAGNSVDKHEIGKIIPYPYYGNITIIREITLRQHDFYNKHNRLPDEWKPKTEEEYYKWLSGDREI